MVNWGASGFAIRCLIFACCLLFVEYVFVLHGSFQKMPLIDWFRYMNITVNKVSVHYIFELIAGVLDLGLFVMLG